MKTSIIMTCYDQLQSTRHMSMAAVANIIRYTDPKDYELIVVDCLPKYPFRDDYHIFGKYILLEVLEEDIGYYRAMDLGAEKASGEYICFIENDVFVHKSWLERLSYYLDNDLLDAIMPNQIPCTYEQQQYFDSLELKDALGKGASEQGLILMKQESFNKIGGWDKKLKMGYGWKRFYQQMDKESIRYANTAAVTITHITGVTYYNTYELDHSKHTKISHIEGAYHA